MNKENIQLWLPLKNAILTQGFGENANSSYVKDGLIGHTGYDYVTQFDDEILAVEDGYIYKIINASGDFSKFRAVFQLVVLDDNYVVEICYGHANRIFVSNNSIECGRRVISEGNTGSVFANGKEVSVEAREKGSKEGTHLHIQARPCHKVKEAVPTLSFERPPQYLSSQEDQSLAYRDTDGYLYHIVDYYNGFHGCVPVKWTRYAGDSIIMNNIISILKVLINLFKK